jgi:hypothetical protein
MAKSRAALALKEWRARRGLNQTLAAVECGIDTFHLSKLECGTRLPGRKLGLRIERVTGILVEWWDEAPLTAAQPDARVAS